MSISFERFVALTAALAAASSVMAGCGDDDSTTNPGSGGKGGTAGKAGSAGRAGSSTGAGSGGKSGAGGKGGAPSTGGSAGAEEGGNGAAPASAGEGGLPASGGTAQGGSSGNEPTAGAGAEGGAGATPGSSGEAGQGGAGGAPEEPCFGDEGAGYCFGLPDGDVPSDECLSGPNPAFRSCVYSEALLRARVLDAHAACLIPITDACTLRAAVATDECERETLRRACSTPQADDICANGFVGSSSVLPSPVVACDDGTLTLATCAHMLSAVATAALENIVRCSDPAGEYGSVFSGTCAERLQQCIFPHGALYP